MICIPWCLELACRTCSWAHWHKIKQRGTCNNTLSTVRTVGSSKSSYRERPLEDAKPPALEERGAPSPPPDLYFEAPPDEPKLDPAPLEDLSAKPPLRRSSDDTPVYLVSFALACKRPQDAHHEGYNAARNCSLPKPTGIPSHAPQSETSSPLSAEVVRLVKHHFLSQMRSPGS